MNEEKTARYSPLSERTLGLNSYQIALALIKYAKGSIEQAGELARELCYHRNFSSLPSIFLEEFFMELWLIKHDLDAWKEPYKYLDEEATKKARSRMELLEKRLEGIPMPFKFKPGVFV